MSNIRGVRILGGTVSVSGTSTVSIGGFESDAITQLKNIRADEIQLRNNQNHFRVVNASDEDIQLQILENLKEINQNIKILIED